METQTSDEQIAQAIAKYNVADATIAEAAKHAGVLKIMGLNDVGGYSAVKHAKARFRKMRTGVESVRKELKADALKFGRAVDAEAKRITALIAPTETELQEKMDEIDNEKLRLEKEEAERLATILADRCEKLRAFGVELKHMDEIAVGRLSPKDYDAQLEVARLAHEIAEQVKKEEAEEELRKRQAAKVEAERLKTEAEELRRERVAMEAERQQLAIDKAQHEAREAKRHEHDKPKPETVKGEPDPPIDLTYQPAESEAEACAIEGDRQPAGTLAQEAEACIDLYELTEDVDVLLSFVRQVAVS